MTPEDVRQIAAWLEASGLDQLELITPQMRLRLQLGGDPASAPVEDDAPPQSPTAAPCLEARGTGVFLPAHPWRDTPLVQPGQQVRAGEIVGLLRVGSLLQPVTAVADGIVGRQIATPGAMVGFGTPLMEFSPAHRSTGARHEDRS